MATREATRGALRLVRMLFAALRRRHRRRIAIRELRALPEWQLKDIGIGRDDIPAVVGAFLKTGPGPRARSTLSRARLVTSLSTTEVAANDNKRRLTA